jgi:hypothetical protein
MEKNNECNGKKNGECLQSWPFSAIVIIIINLLDDCCNIDCCMQACTRFTVEPELSGTVLSGHPLLSGNVAKSRKFHNINAI